MQGFIHGSGGLPLNFKVVGNPQPANPKKNMIWVNTDQKITGYYFQAEQPENMAEGELWFPTGTSSPVEFNALKKNGLQVYPISAKQYIDGAWVRKEAKTYQNGAWMDWIAYLYNKGDECTDVTGGWVHVSGATGEYWDPTTLEKNPTNISLKFFDEWHQIGEVRTAEKIDLTNRSTLYVNITGLTLSDTFSQNAAYVGACVDSVLWDQYAAGIKLKSGQTGLVTIDISSLKGEYYISIGGNQESSGETDGFITFDEVRLK